MFNPAFALIRQLNLLRNGIGQESLVQLESEAVRMCEGGVLRYADSSSLLPEVAMDPKVSSFLGENPKSRLIQVNQEYDQENVKAPFQIPAFRAG